MKYVVKTDDFRIPMYFLDAEDGKFKLTNLADEAKVFSTPKEAHIAALKWLDQSGIDAIVIPKP